MKIAKESWILAAIGLADLVTTIIFIEHHGAHEANPLFQRYWDMGIPVFIAAKMVCLLCPLLVLEWARRRNERFVNAALRTAIVGYLLFYCVGILHLNAPHREGSFDGSSGSSGYFGSVASGQEMRSADPAFLRWRGRVSQRFSIGSSLAWKPIAMALLQYRHTGHFPVAGLPLRDLTLPMPAPASLRYIGQRDD